MPESFRSDPWKVLFNYLCSKIQVLRDESGQAQGARLDADHLKYVTKQVNDLSRGMTNDFVSRALGIPQMTKWGKTNDVSEWW